MEQVIQLFENYVQNFDLTNPDIKRKYDHSYRVMELSNELANSIHLSKRDCELARLIGLLHDIGRFEQLKTVHSYNDFQFEHADYGATYLQDSSFLDPLLLTEEEKLVIVSAVKYHNKYELPNHLEERTELFCKLIRDADKLDIFSLTLQLPKKDLGRLNPEIKKEFFLGRSCHIHPEMSSYDYVLVRLGFLHNLYFLRSFQIFSERHYLDIYFKILGEKEELKEYFDYSRNYLEQKLKEE